MTTRIALPLAALSMLWAVCAAAAIAEDRPTATDSTVGLSLVVREPHAEWPVEVYVGDVLEHRFAIENSGATPVTILETKDGSQRARSLTATPREIPAGGRAELQVIQPASKLGAFSFRYSFVTDEPGRPRYRVSLSGFAQSAYDPESHLVDFGFVDAGTGATASFELASREVDRLEIVGSDDLPVGFTLGPVERIGIAGEAVRVPVAIAPGTALGLHTGNLVVRTNVAHQPRHEIAYRANVFADVVPSTNPIELGLGVAGRVLETTVRLASRSGRPFTFTVDTAGDARVAAAARSCGGELPTACWLLDLRAESAVADTYEGAITVRVADRDEAFSLRWLARFVSPGTVIKQIEVPAATFDGSTSPEGGRR